jgi:hypothetical protein
MLTLHPEGFGPLTVLVIPGKKGGKLSVDICGGCYASFVGETAIESAEKLRVHVLTCPKYVSPRS